MCCSEPWAGQQSLSAAQAELCTRAGGAEILAICGRNCAALCLTPLPAPGTPQSSPGTSCTWLSFRRMGWEGFSLHSPRQGKQNWIFLLTAEACCNNLRANVNSPVINFYGANSCNLKIAIGQGPHNVDFRDLCVRKG